MKQRDFIQTDSFETQLAAEAVKLRKEAWGTPPGIKREQLIRRARQAETGSHVRAWLRSPELQPPK